MIQPFGPDRQPRPGEPTQSPRQEAQRLDAAIDFHAWEAAQWAEATTGAEDDYDAVYAHAAKAQAHAAAAQALALLRDRGRRPEYRTGAERSGR